MAKRWVRRGWSATCGPAAVSAGHCRAEGVGLDESVVGRESHFSVHVHDRFGNPREGNVKAYLVLKEPLLGARLADGPASAVAAAVDAYGPKASETARGRPGSREAMSLTARSALVGIDRPHGQGRLEVNVGRDADDNSVRRCVYRAQHAGEYSLHVSSEGVPISGSPFALSVLPEYLKTTAASISGRGLRDAVAGTTATFHMMPRDTLGQPIKAIEHLPSIAVRVTHRDTSKQAECWLAAGADSGVNISYRSFHAGPHDVWVTQNGAPLPGCPHHVTVRPASVCP